MSHDEKIKHCHGKLIEASKITCHGRFLFVGSEVYLRRYGKQNKYIAYGDLVYNVVDFKEG